MSVFYITFIVPEQEISMFFSFVGRNINDISGWKLVGWASWLVDKDDQTFYPPEKITDSQFLE